MASLSYLETLVSVGNYPQSHLDAIKSFVSDMKPFQTDPVVDIGYHGVTIGLAREYMEDRSHVEYVQLSWYNAGVTIEITKKRIILYLTEIHATKSPPVSALYRDGCSPQVILAVRNLATSWATMQSLRDTFGDSDDSEEESS